MKRIYLTAAMEIVDFDVNGIVMTDQIGGSGTSTETGGGFIDVGNITVPGYEN